MQVIIQTLNLKMKICIHFRKLKDMQKIIKKGSGENEKNN